MNSEKRKELEQRRWALQVRREAEAFVASDLEPYLAVLDELRKRDVAFEIVQLTYIKPEWIPHVEAVLQESPYVDYGFGSDHVNNNPIGELLEELFVYYPSINPLRYVPELTQYADYYTVPSENILRDGLQKCITDLRLSDDKVYLHYLGYAPVVELSLTDLAYLDHDDLFSSWHGDALIFPSTLNWLIAFSLEDAWYGGRK